jgi:intracellular sulfur oxidation DsrE/DsrF family protein
VYCHTYIMKPKITLLSVLYTWLLVTSQFAMANEVTGEEFKPFAEKHVVLQMSDQANEAVVLNTANNLIKNYGGPDMIDIEIVTFGKGVRLMYGDSPHKVRIASLVENGVRFYVCRNTLDTMERIHGERPKINPAAIMVQAGVAHIIDKVDEGYILIRP